MRAAAEHDDVLVAGYGVSAAIGQGRAAFGDALLAGAHRFDVMRRPGRQRPADGDDAGTAFLGAEIGELAMPDAVPRALLRTASWSAQVALATLHEAWLDARLADLDPERIGLVVGGSNLQQRELVQAQASYRGREAFLRPTYGLSFMDSDLCGLASEVFGIRGFALTAGGASASGQVALIQAAQAVRAGQVDACIALGALMDLSHWECQGLRSLGAMGSQRHAHDPAAACRPFDAARDGFIFGEGCAAIVVERAGSAHRAGLAPRARIAGWGMAADANRNPNPSLAGETRAIATALRSAGLDAAAIDYVNPHGTGSDVGDTTELAALRGCGLDHARINATKSLTGHGLSAAGAVELAAILVQMERGALHPTRNLDTPIDAGFAWVRERAEPHAIGAALNLSMGFGGVNTAVCLQRL